MIHWPILFGHHAIKGAALHAAHSTAKAAGSHAVAAHAAGHTAVVTGTAAKTAAVTRVAAHGTVARRIAATAVSAAPKVPMVP